MADRFHWWLWASGSAALICTVTLIIVKLAHRAWLRWRGVRSAHYIGALGEILSRQMIPADPPKGWAADPLFHAAVVEYRLTLTGEDREFIDRFVANVGILDVLSRQIRSRLFPARRLRAVSSFVDLATRDQIPRLRTLLNDSTHAVAIHAATGLSRLGDIDSITTILDRAVMAPPWHAGRLADSLIRMGPSAGGWIREWIEDQIDGPLPPLETVALAARVLGLITDIEAEPVLLRLLHSDHAEWRVAAASALGSIGGEHTVSELVIALTDESWPVRARAAAAIGDLAAPAALDELAPALSDPVWWVRQNAAEAVGKLPGGTDTLIDVLNGSDPYAADAALHQLTIIGHVADAADRARQGVATTRDVTLLSHIGRAPDVNRDVEVAGIQ